MTDESTAINKKLKLGIDAARAGKKNIAQVHLNAVLQLDAHNVAAMFWLAYVSPSAQESISLFERILELDPANERAKAGMQWARGRLSAEAAAPAESDGATEGQNLRQQVLSGKIQEKARKGVLAHRARRTIDSMTVLLVLIAALTLVALGLVAFTMVPTDTLAAWLPVTPPAADDLPALEPAPAVVQPLPTGTAASGLTSAADTVQFDPTPLVELEVDNIEFTEAKPEGAVEAALAVPPAETDFIFNLPDLIGPQLPVESISPEVETETEPAVDPAEQAAPESIAPVENAVSESPPLVVDNLPLAHQPAYPGEKWIEINVTTQQVTAWEGDTPVFTFIASTGLPNTPTVLGEYNIYWKLESTLMSGPGYYLPDVPYTMYFYGGYALHGTYWHENFGQPMSHGCVNLKTDEAQRLFEWADPVLPPGQTQVTATADNPGTLVVVHQ